MNPKQKKKGHLKNVAVEGSKEIGPRPALPAESNGPWGIPAICVFLAVITLAVFGRTMGYGFVNFDDDIYVYKNPSVAAGLTLKGIASAFKPGETDNWVPLTTISHMLDCQLYGLNAGGHHLTNVLLHTTSVILLFLVLRLMTGAVWRSAFVAVVFAVHPLRVESVAWVSERKDTLSGVFFMLTLWAYVRYVRKPSSLPRYLIVLLLFALGLMSKPMLVTLPFVLLLLDYWPLKRFSDIESVPWLKNFSAPARLILEKIPLLMLSIASCILTVLVQGQNHAIQSLNNLPFSLRTGNALVSCVTYVRQMFYPIGLAPQYPYPSNGLPFWKIIGAFMILAAISWGVFGGRRKCPYLLVGWLWYLGMLTPVIGLVQVGEQALADRYTYLPQIGLYLMLVWLIAELSAAWRNRRLILGGLASIAIAGMAISAYHQNSYWRSSEILWAHTLDVTTNNPVAHLNLGVALYQKGDVDKAMIEYQHALAIDPNYATPYYDLGFDFLQKKQVDKAITEYQQALAIDPDNALAYNDLGNCFLQKNQVDDAIVEFQKALAIDSDNSDIYCNLGNALVQKGQVDEAILDYQKALAINPNDTDLYCNLGNALAQKGRLDEAILDYQKGLALNSTNAQGYYNYGSALIQKGQMDKAIIQFQKALAVQPSLVEAQNNLARMAWALGTSPDPSIRNGIKAIELARQTDQLAGGGNPMVAASLAAAYAEMGNFTEAITNAQRALRLASSQSNAAMISVFQAQLNSYQADSALRASGATH
jgi:protein O-mannosyl-transferase